MSLSEETDTNTMNSLIDRESADPNCVSMKSDESVRYPPGFSSGDSGADVSNTTESVKGQDMDLVFQELEQKIISLMKKELKIFKSLLSTDYPACSEREEEEDDEDQIKVREKLLKITLHILKKINQTNLADKLQSKLVQFSLKKHKSRLTEKFQRINEGISSQGNSTLVNEIYTELYITEGGSEELNNEHEVRQIETTSRRSETQETPIKCNDIFKALPGQDKHIRTVLTKGVAGIGKTVSVQKFILDWSEGKANQDLHFIFPLPFRELNLMKNRNISLMDLLHQFFIDTKELRSRDFDVYKVVFIFDGLDECRLPLDFSNNQSLSDLRERASVDVLLTNLIKGNLLPSALIWITSRPAAANQIPSDCVDQITDVRGFNDPQKDEYFIKRINDESLSNRIIKHIKSSRSLYIMCHIPVFCWITATVLERMLSESESQAEIPKTLTHMFTHFLIFQTKLNSQKHDGKCEVDLQQVRKSLLSLGKLAFQQLEKENLIFYEEDLRECNIDVKKASVYSGVCTQIFREELGLNLGKVYSFVHLSIQEFLAALFKFLCFILDKKNKSRMSELLKSEVDKALQSENGHLDLYLQFLLGLLLESNQTILQQLLRQTGRRSDSRQEIVEYIKMKIRDNHSPEKSINLFHCLNELNDHSLEHEVQTYLNQKDYSSLSEVKLSPSQWSALVFVLLNSDQKLDEFILSKYDQSDECLQRLLPVIKASRKADLSLCNLTEKSCSSLSSVLSSNSSSLTELNLSYNKLQDSGVKLLSDGLKNTNCKLKILHLRGCNLKENSCLSLTSVLISNSSSLTELNMSNNTLQDSGVKLLSDGLKNVNCKLKILHLSLCNLTEKSCSSLSSVLISNSSSLTELNLSNNNLQDSGVKILADALKNTNCKLKILNLSSCNITEKERSCSALASVFSSSFSSLTELNLYSNKLFDSGAKLLFAGLKNTNCKLKTLNLGFCHLTEKSCSVLSSVLSSNSSSLTELKLIESNLYDSGAKLLSDGLKNTNCKLKILNLDWCFIGDEGFVALASALRSNPSHLTELSLNHNNPGDSGVKLIFDVLKDQPCKLQKLLLKDCKMTERSCSSLSSVLSSNSSSLTELNLSGNELQDSGVKLLSDGLKNTNCKLKILNLESCSIRKEGFVALASALRSNPSHLTELNLYLNYVGDSRKLMSDLLKDPHCKLKTLQI
ncbi:NACHT, LRR and PYD domains-containing protein 3 isoform X1 [Misgurnus anguillicaudatus]|uniref:NACHT, LRR and PYD domains-containing protein 3 isoform X1 n=1 Tax=Misgurnus anguillicaudatus TaxID=75329 RepID=UPI003CCF1188